MVLNVFGSEKYSSLWVMTPPLYYKIHLDQCDVNVLILYHFHSNGSITETSVVDALYNLLYNLYIIYIYVMIQQKKIVKSFLPLSLVHWI